MTTTAPIKVLLTTLGCARNDVDSEELAARLDADGFELVQDQEQPALIVINTCGFIEQAKKDSIDTILAAHETGVPVVAVGCMAERYGTELAKELPEAAAVLGFDDYPDIADRLKRILAGEQIIAPTPKDRRNLLPLSPVDRPAFNLDQPGHAISQTLGGPKVLRKRLSNEPFASLKIASGCDRRCTFCAIPRFRGSFISRDPQDILQEASWLADHGVKELVLVSENSTSFGKDLGNNQALELLLPRLAEIKGIDRVRVTYLQPAEMRPTLIQTICNTPGVVPYFDLSFQHASPTLLRRMKRFGGTQDFMNLITEIRKLSPEAGIRSNFIVGFPGETQADFEMLEDFLNQAQLDAVGVFGFSIEDGTEAADFADQLPEFEINQRVSHLSSVADELVSQRAQARIGTETYVVVDSIHPEIEARADHQGPETDGSCLIETNLQLQVGDRYLARVIDSYGADLVVELI